MPKNIRRQGVGRRTFEKDVEALRVASNTYGGGGVGTDHGSLTGRADDDHQQYAHLSQAESVVGQWQFAPASAIPPFTLNANAQGQLVTGLNADLLDSLNTSNDPGVNDRVLTTTSAGLLTLELLNITSGIGSDLFPTLTDTYDLGSSSKLWRKGYLSELEALLFVEESIHVEGGWLIVGHDQGTFPSDVANTDDTIDFGKAMTVGDFVLCRGYLQVEYFEVGVLVSGTTYKVGLDGSGDRDLDGSGANDWPAGAVFLVLGNTGDGRIEFVASQTDSPRISILEQGATYNAQTERVRIGNMRDSYGVGSNDYYGFGVGDYSGGNYLKYNVTNGFSMKVGAGSILLNSSGIGVTPSTAIDGSRSYRFLKSDSTGISSAIYGVHSLGNSHSMELVVGSITGEDSYASFSCDYPTGQESSLFFTLVKNSLRQVDLFLDDGRLESKGNFVGTSPDLRVNGSMQIRDSDYVDQSVAAGDLYVEHNIRAGDLKAASGLMVGETSQDPGTGYARITNGLQVGSNSSSWEIDDCLYVVDQILINDGLNGRMTHGLTINSYDGSEMIALKNTSVVHYMTTPTETDTFGSLKIVTDNVGGLLIEGYTETSVGAILYGRATSPDSTTSTAGRAATEIQSGKRSGSGTAALVASENVFAVRNLSTTELIVKYDGRLFVNENYSGPTGALVGKFDEYDDIKLLAGVRGLSRESLRESFEEFVDYARPVLEATETVVFNDGQYGNDDDGSMFISVQGMFHLHNDAIRQLHRRFTEEIKLLERKVLQLEARNESNK